MQDETMPLWHNANTQEFRILEELRNNLKLFGQKLKDAREARGYTQKALGKLIGIEANSVARIEAGVRPPSWPVLEKIFSSLGQPPAYYFSPEASVTEITKPTPEQALEVIRKALAEKQPPQPPTPPIPKDILEDLAYIKDWEPIRAVVKGLTERAKKGEKV